MNYVNTLTYIWFEDMKEDFKEKVLTVEFLPRKTSDLSIWNYKKCYFGPNEKEHLSLFLHPVILFNDPFNINWNKLVLCDVYDFDPDESMINNCSKPDDNVKYEMEQKYTILGYEHYYLLDKKAHYCAIGADKIFGRDINESHYKACLLAGVNICESNAESLPAQWSYKIGPCDKVMIARHSYMARYILNKLVKQFKIEIIIEKKPLLRIINNRIDSLPYSPIQMRNCGGLSCKKNTIDDVIHTSVINTLSQDNNNGTIAHEFPEYKKDKLSTRGITEQLLEHSIT